MDLKAILNNKPLLIGIIVGVILLVVLISVFAFNSSNQNGAQQVKEEKVIKEPFRILTTDNLGKAIEIQALLAREGITAHREENGSKSTLILKEYKMSERDRALLAIVKSGLMDEHIGLEIFDKGDFTSTKDDKRIRLSRAINGELSRLIRKIPPIENASVFVSIPEPTMFTSMQKPVTATVQLSVPSGERLEKDKIKAITNLLLGSVQGLEASNISITDTNGNVYSSIMNAEDDRMSIIEENDAYMKKKVQAQLDRLVGKGNYVVTVSTYLREIPEETNKLLYDPVKKSVVSEQRFEESLGDRNSDIGRVTSAVSSYLPSGLPRSAASSQNRNYNRSAQELQYGVSKTQVTEYKKPGMLEEISIALTIEQGAIPETISIPELKELVARAASPKAKPENVEIVFSNTVSPFLSSERPVKLPEPEESGNPWWTVAVLLGIALVAGLVYITNRAKAEASKHEEEIKALRNKTMIQDTQLKEMNERAAALIAQQEQLQKAVLSNQNAVPQLTNLQEVINNVKDEIEEEYTEEEVGQYLKSWIESSSS